MISNRVLKLAALLLTLTLVACAAYRTQSAARRAPGGPGEGFSHEQSRPDREFTELPEADQIARIRGEVSAVKESLAREGRYVCCVEPVCTECLLRYGECHCREALREEGPCCGECTELWVEGKGVVEGITAWEVLERKKDVLRRVSESGGGAAPPAPAETPPPPHHHH
jgi:hypothetical protein